MVIMVNITINYRIMNIKTMTAVDAKTRFGQFIDAAQREPVVVTKKNRPVGVFFSVQDIKDTMWWEAAKKAHKEWYYSSETSLDFLTNLSNA